MRITVRENTTPKAVLLHMLIVFVSLMFNGLGVACTMAADIGVGPWEVLTVGLSKSLGILYGNVSIAVSVVVIALDLVMREPLGLAMLLEAVTVGKTVDLIQYLGFLPAPKTLLGSIALLLAGLAVIGYAQFFYMSSALGCGSKDALLVGLKRRIPKIPIGVVCIALLCVVTFAGWLMGGPVGIGTVLFAVLCGPAMQLAFRTFGAEPTEVAHQNILASIRVLTGRRP